MTSSALLRLISYVCGMLSWHPVQEDQFHLVDNRPTKTTKFGQRRFQQNKFAQQRRERDAARAEREKREGGGQQKQQKKNPWAQQHWREQQRVSSHATCSVP